MERYCKPWKKSRFRIDGNAFFWKLLVAFSVSIKHHWKIPAFFKEVTEKRRQFINKATAFQQRLKKLAYLTTGMYAVWYILLTVGITLSNPRKKFFEFMETLIEDSYSIGDFKKPSFFTTKNNCYMPFSICLQWPVCR